MPLITKFFKKNCTYLRHPFFFFHDCSTHGCQTFTAQYIQIKDLACYSDHGRRSTANQQLMNLYSRREHLVVHSYSRGT